MTEATITLKQVNMYLLNFHFAKNIFSSKKSEKFIKQSFPNYLYDFSEKCSIKRVFKTLFLLYDSEVVMQETFFYIIILFFID